MRAAGALIGVVFGFLLCWSGMSNPDVIRSALLFEESYLFLFFGAAVFTSAVGVNLLRRYRARALLNDLPLRWTPERPQRRHVVGSLMFGAGWGIANTCPGPILTQVGQGIPWALLTLLGTVVGVYLYLRRTGLETEPACDTPRTQAQLA